jgi:hypothetical protein
VALAGLTVTATTGTTVTLAEADFVGSATLTAVTLTVFEAGATGGAKYTAEDPLVEIVPQDEPLQLAPFRFQLTAVFEAPVTLAVKS